MFEHVKDTWAGGRNLLPAAMGLVGETGEVVDYVKKVLFKPGFMGDRQHLREELGDVGYYLGAVSMVVGYNAQDVEAYAQKCVEDYSTSNSQHTITFALSVLAGISARVLTIAASQSGQLTRFEFDGAIHAWVAVCKAFESDPNKIMEDNKKKLSGGRHGWPEQPQ